MSQRGQWRDQTTAGTAGWNVQELVDLGHDDTCPVQVDRGASAGRHISADPGVVPAEATATTALAAETEELIH